MKNGEIYRNRVIDCVLERKLAGFGAVLVEGPKWCGKTTTCGLVEIKLGGEALIEEGAKTLNELSGLIDTSRQKEVSFKMVLTAVGDFAYRRKDGVIVCPIGALKP